MRCEITASVLTKALWYSSAVYASPDGLTWTALRKKGDAPVHGDDTKPTGNWDPSLGKYVIYDRTRVKVRGDITRSIGRCETSSELQYI